MRLAMFVFFMLTSTLLGQQIEVNRKFLVEGLESLEDHSGYLLANEQPVLRVTNVALVKIPVEPDLAIVDFEVLDAAKNEIDVCDVTSDDKSATYIIKTTGKVKFKVNYGGIVSGKLVFKKRSIDVDLGGVPIPPPPPPPGSCDGKTNPNFDGLSKRACQWVNDTVTGAGTTKRAELAKLYIETASKLELGQYKTLNEASNALVTQRSALLGNDAAAWSEFFNRATNDFQKYWANETTNTDKRALTAKFYRSLGEGLQ